MPSETDEECYNSKKQERSSDPHALPSLLSSGFLLKSTPIKLSLAQNNVVVVSSYV